MFSGVLAFGQMDRDVPNLEKTTVINMDLVVQGSTCVGFDCVNSESFGFDTHRLKENNLRIHFHDTSTSASFPSNDWRISINDTSNGGANHFSIDDATAGTTPFRITAGAGNHALFVSSSGGNVGLGTSTPVVELHISDGDTPTMRLEQSGASGFTPQTWDVAGNETNFFVRDVTNGSKLPFKIRPGATTNALYIDTDGDIAINQTTSNAQVDIKSSGNDDSSAGLKVANSSGAIGLYVRDDGRVGIGRDNPTRTFHVEGSGQMFDGYFSRNAASGAIISLIGTNTFGLVGTNTNHPLVFRTNDVEAIRILTNNNVGIGITNPSTQLEITGVATKPGGGSWTAPSDKRLKKNIKKYSEGLETLIKFNPVSYQYNGKGGIKDTETVHIGLIAQEAQEVASYMVSDIGRTTVVKSGDKDIESSQNYLAVDPSAIPYMLINSVKEQQAQLDAKEAKIENLESKVSKLEEAITLLIEKIDGTSISNGIDHEEDLVLSIDQLPFLKQNVPNPYNTDTSIEYFIPENSELAQMYFYDNQGRLLKKHNLSSKGTGKLNLKIADLPSGTYVYSLVVDGKQVSSKKMSVQ